MKESVSKIVSQLRFRSGPVETVYLNEIRLRERFIAHLGAIEDFTRSGLKEGSAEVPLLKFGGKLGQGTSVTWSLSDPVAQALVLRAALEEQDVLVPPAQAKPGDYVVVSGQALLSRPEAFTAGLAPVPPELLAELEEERQRQEQWLRAMEGPEAAMWLLVLAEGGSFNAAVLDNRWLRPGLPSFLGSDIPWELLAILRSRTPTVLLLAGLHVTVRWQS